MATSNGHAGITEDEAALYDRQIRLWGVDAQNRLRSASVLVYNFRGIAAEIVKNIVLAGVGSLTLLDQSKVQANDLGCNFFLREEDVGKGKLSVALPRVQNLNPRVQITANTLVEQLYDLDYLKQFDLIILTDVSGEIISKVNELTRKAQLKLSVASSIGLHGWILNDLIKHEYLVDKIVASAGETTKVPAKHSLHYPAVDVALAHSFEKMRPKLIKKTDPLFWCVLAHIKSTSLENISLSDAVAKLALSNKVPGLAVDAKIVDDFLRLIGTEFSPSAAILGGIAGQDAINIISGKEEPVNNFMLFNGLTGEGKVWRLD